MTAFIFVLPAESGVTDGARAGLVCVHLLRFAGGARRVQRCAAARGSSNDACADGSCSHTPCVIVALQTRCSERRLQNALPRVQLMLDRHCCLQRLRGWRTGTGALPNLPVYVAKSCDLAFRSLPPYCPRRSLPTLRSCRCCPWIALQDDRSEIGPRRTPPSNLDPWLPAAIIMLQLCI